MYFGRWGFGVRDIKLIKARTVGNDDQSTSPEGVDGMVQGEEKMEGVLQGGGRQLMPHSPPTWRPASDIYSHRSEQNAHVIFFIQGLFVKAPPLRLQTPKSSTTVFVAYHNVDY